MLPLAAKIYTNGADIMPASEQSLHNVISLRKKEPLKKLRPHQIVAHSVHARMRVVDLAVAYWHNLFYLRCKCQPCTNEQMAAPIGAGEKEKRKKNRSTMEQKRDLCTHTGWVRAAMPEGNVQ